jgi:pimeloyl-ACP methyl ester carboxylesterase
MSQLTTFTATPATLVMTTVIGVLATPLAGQTICELPPQPTFTVSLPKLGLPPDEEGQGWNRPPVWEHHPDSTDDSITVPNGRAIYALIISGYASNAYLDEMMVYNFARHLQAQGAYVHYSWWNNLLAPYMKRPLHHHQSHPGSLTGNLLDFTTATQAGQKAVPAEDYQFVADAKRFLSAIRENNPSAMIIVVGHSMGGGATVHLGHAADVVIDILAPIDPVGNRNYPWAGIAPNQSHFNWTRWRVSRDNFLGFQSLEWGGIGVGCVPHGPWLKNINEIDNDVLCTGQASVHQAPTLDFGSNIINLHHRYQKEATFPFDYDDDHHFGHFQPPNGVTSQSAVNTLSSGEDPGGWPLINPFLFPCCATGEGVGWSEDGHGEIVGYRGPIVTGGPVPLGVRLRTSPQCGNCDNLTWPSRSFDDGAWSNGNGAARANLLKALEALSPNTAWPHRPKNPGLCKVSAGLINRYNNMNKPPFANAGEDQIVECTGQTGTTVYLDGSASSDPESDSLEYEWEWPGGSAFGAVTSIVLPMGTHCVTLTIRDPSGHIDRDIMTATVQDTTPPELTITLSKQLLWPPNHTMKHIAATVEAIDLCGTVTDLSLVSIVCNQPDDAIGSGDGDTINDIQDVTQGVLDTTFKLRAERAGQMGDRIYTITYQATDDSGNRGEVSVDVIVPKNWNSYQNWLQILN